MTALHAIFVLVVSVVIARRLDWPMPFAVRGFIATALVSTITLL